MHESLLHMTPELTLDGYIAGIDEVGRGCIAGPVVAACVVFSWKDVASLRALDDRVRIRDSKKMTRAQRKLASDLLRDAALYVGVGVVDPLVIDEINILQATFLAMKGAVQDAFRDVERGDLLQIRYFIDGNMKVPDVSWDQETIIGGDAKVFSIAAASIIAKEYRDLLMEQADVVYPNYHFGAHKGYGTQLHYAAIQKHGILPLHRKTFLKRFNEA